MTEIYRPIEGEILHLTDGTPIKVNRVAPGYFIARRLDGENFTDEQAEGYMNAGWNFDGTRGIDDLTWNSTGMNFVFPQNDKQALELKVQQLGGTVTWTDPDLLLARTIWAKHARPNGGWGTNAILAGDIDTGAVMQAILEALRIQKGN